jgi:hypothetical protein
MLIGGRPICNVQSGMHNARCEMPHLPRLELAGPCLRTNWGGTSIAAFAVFAGLQSFEDAMALLAHFGCAEKVPVDNWHTERYCA